MFFKLRNLLIFICLAVSGYAKGEVSGFARLVAGVVDDDELEYFFYSDEVSIKSQSLFGLRADYTLGQKVDVVVQGVAYGRDSRSSELTQAYLSYRPLRSTNIKIGRYIAPLFSVSESYDIGFSYPWITPPQQVYSEYLFIKPEGILLTHEFGNRAIAGSFDIYWGQLSQEFVIAGLANDAESKAAKGIVLNLVKGGWNSRVSFHDAHFDIDRKDVKALKDTLNMAGYISLANSISLAGTIKFYQIAVNYDDVDYFIRSEWAKVKTDIFVMPEIESAYFTAGFNFYPFAVYSTLAWSDYSYANLQNTIPLGLDPRLDQLQNIIGQFDDLLDDDSLKSVSIGARYELTDSLALKLEATFLDGKDGQRAFFNKVSDKNIEREAMLYQLALEWVF
jgi:hypothetical protein